MLGAGDFSASIRDCSDVYRNASKNEMGLMSSQVSSTSGSGSCERVDRICSNRGSSLSIRGCTFCSGNERINIYSVQRREHMVVFRITDQSTDIETGQIVCCSRVSSDPPQSRADVIQLLPGKLEAGWPS